MNNQEFAPFYVGQEVEAVITGAHIKKGDKYVISSIKKYCCLWVATLEGIVDSWFMVGCHKCEKILQDEDGIAQVLISTELLRAITPALEAVTFEKITEQHPVSVN